MLVVEECVPIESLNAMVNDRGGTEKVVSDLSLLLGQYTHYRQKSELNPSDDDGLVALLHDLISLFGGESPYWNEENLVEEDEHEV